MTAVVSVNYAFDRDAFLDAAKTLLKTRFSEVGADAESFLIQVWGDALADDLTTMSLGDMVKEAAEFWGFGAERQIGKLQVRIRSAVGEDGRDLGRDILEVIGRDRPFLVDSIMGEIASHGLDILAMFHPVVQVRRDEDGHRVQTGGRALPESMIQVHLDALGDAMRERLEEGVRATLSDVRDAVDDWNDMRAQMDDAIEHLSKANTPASREELDEAVSFLSWLRNNHFAFLGCRTYTFGIDENGMPERREPDILPDSGRGVLRDPDRSVLRKSAEPLLLTPAIEAYMRAPSPVIVAKANMKSRVHRRVYMDYIGVKRYREDGAVIGETRFVGLFTAEAYDQMAREVPLIRRKVRRVLEKAAKTPGSHSAKKLQNIVENYPRDELFQTDEADLLQISLGILHLYDRPRTKLFMRRDQFDRFVSCLLFVPRDRYNSKVREDAGNLIRDAFNGRLSAFYPSFGDSPLARVHFIIGLDPFNHPEPDPNELEQRIVALARTWEDDLHNEARASDSPAVRRAAPNYLGGFTAGYRERFTSSEGLRDITRMEGLHQDRTLCARAYRHDGETEKHIRVKLYQLDQPLALSRVLPVLENLGLHVLAEAGYPVRRETGRDDDGDRRYETIWVHEFEALVPEAAVGDVSTVAEAFESALLAVLEDRAEDDGFNRLVLAIGVSWREAAFLRTCARYRQQSGLDPSQALQEEAFAANPDIARKLLNLAATRFDPSLKLSLDERKARAEALSEESARHARCGAKP
jgi:glutamate dehydrogenase